MSDTKDLLWENLQGYIDRNVVPFVAKMENEAGHEMLYSPLHYSDLQTIETVWGIVSGYVGQQYKTETACKDVLVGLKATLNNLERLTAH